MGAGQVRIGEMMVRTGAAISLCLLAPVFLLLALGVWATMGAPVLFRQERCGFGGKPFVMLKFRSMNDRRGSDGSPLPDEQRVTAFGRFLRRSRLDELPGLVNIVSGDLALVGPRPLLPETIKELGARGAARCRVRPGLTGWSQVNGNTRLSLRRKIDLDLWYIEHKNWLLDAQILARTLSVMIFGERESQFVRDRD